MTEKSKDQPIIVEEIKEEKKEMKEETRQSVQPTEEDLCIDSANYLSEVLQIDFSAAMRYARRFPGLTK